jgi:hypothetical protein
LISTARRTDGDDYFTHPIVRVGQDYTLKVGETVRQLQSVLADACGCYVERDAW